MSGYNGFEPADSPVADQRDLATLFSADTNKTIATNLSAVQNGWHQIQNSLLRNIGGRWDNVGADQTGYVQPYDLTDDTTGIGAGYTLSDALTKMLSGWTGAGSDEFRKQATSVVNYGLDVAQTAGSPFDLTGDTPMTSWYGSTNIIATTYGIGYSDYQRTSDEFDGWATDAANAINSAVNAQVGKATNWSAGSTGYQGGVGASHPNNATISHYGDPLVYTLSQQPAGSITDPSNYTMMVQIQGPGSSVGPIAAQDSSGANTVTPKLLQQHFNSTYQESFGEIKHYIAGMYQSSAQNLPPAVPASSIPLDLSSPGGTGVPPAGTGAVNGAGLPGAGALTNGGGGSIKPLTSAGLTSTPLSTGGITPGSTGTNGLTTPGLTTPGLTSTGTTPGLSGGVNPGGTNLGSNGSVIPSTQLAGYTNPATTSAGNPLGLTTPGLSSGGTITPGSGAISPANFSNPSLSGLSTPGALSSGGGIISPSGTGALGLTPAGGLLGSAGSNGLRGSSGSLGDTAGEVNGVPGETTGVPNAEGALTGAEEAALGGQEGGLVGAQSAAAGRMPMMPPGAGMGTQNGQDRPVKGYLPDDRGLFEPDTDALSGPIGGEVSV